MSSDKSKSRRRQETGARREVAPFSTAISATVTALWTGSIEPPPRRSTLPVHFSSAAPYTWRPEPLFLSWRRIWPRRRPGAAPRIRGVRGSCRPRAARPGRRGFARRSRRFPCTGKVSVTRYDRFQFNWMNAPEKIAVRLLPRYLSCRTTKKMWFNKHVALRVFRYGFAACPLSEGCDISDVQELLVRKACKQVCSVEVFLGSAVCKPYLC